MVSVKVARQQKKETPKYRIKEELLNRMEKMDLFYGRNIKVWQAVERAVLFCEENKKFKKWIEKKKQK